MFLLCYLLSYDNRLCYIMLYLYCVYIMFRVLVIQTRQFEREINIFAGLAYILIETVHIVCNFYPFEVVGHIIF